jgi:YjbE family integral membrane protein
MNSFFVFFMKALQIVLADVVLSGDNVGIIALAIKDLPENMAKKANLAGVIAAVSLRILFVLIISVLFSLEWLHIKLLGGLLLIIITYNMVKADPKKIKKKINTSNRFFVAVLSIVVADLSMSLDNVLAIASVATSGGNGSIFDPQQIGLVVFGLAMCIPIIFFGSKLVSNLMKKFPVIIYICAAVLANTAFSMIFQDAFIAKHTGNLGNIIAILSACLVMAYGIYVLYFSKNRVDFKK